MADRPYTLLSCAVSLDGYLNSPTSPRLALSSDSDLERVDAVRATSDAILVGAATIRDDDPRLLVRSPRLRQERMARGSTCSPIKVTMTASGRLDPQGRFFTTGSVDKIVYGPHDVVDTLRSRLGDRATVVAVGSSIGMGGISADLAARGVNRLMVEGGGTTLTQFLAAGLADELQLVIAPVFIGDSRAHRFTLDGRFPWNPDRRAELAEVRRVGDVALLRYALSPRYGTEGIDL